MFDNPGREVHRITQTIDRCLGDFHGVLTVLTQSLNHGQPLPLAWEILKDLTAENDLTPYKIISQD